MLRLHYYIAFMAILLCLPCQGLVNIEPRLVEDLSNIPQRTIKNRKTPGDPINVAIIASKETIHKTFTSAGWSVADELSISKNIRIALDCIFNLSYRKAPISILYYLNKPQDISYQLQHGKSPRKRHHVRFWKILEQKSNEEVWVGAASFDKKVKFNRVTKRFTHKISPNVDKERDLIADIFKKHGFKSTVIDKFHAKLCGKNGEGDYYYTDGKLAILQN